MAAIHKPATLNASLLLARKGEAAPAIAATCHNNPSLAWDGGAHTDHDQASSQQPSRTKSRSPSLSVVATARLRSDVPLARGLRHGPSLRVYLTLRVEDETYLRLKYLAQQSGRSSHQILGDALNLHLGRQGIPQAQNLVVKRK